MLPGREPGRRGGKPATNRLSYGTAYVSLTYQVFHGKSTNFAQILLQLNFLFK
jgi:hypothetical protein